MKYEEKVSIDKKGFEDNPGLTEEDVIRSQMMSLVKRIPMEELGKIFKFEVFDPYSEASNKFLKDFSNTDLHGEAQLSYLSRIKLSRIKDFPEIEITTEIEL